MFMGTKGRRMVIKIIFNIPKKKSKVKIKRRVFERRSRN